MDKFPIFDSLKNSFKFIFENWRHALRVTWPYAIILMAAEAATIIPVKDDGLVGMGLIGFIMMVVFVVLVLCVLAIPSLTWQRAYLKGISPDNLPHPWRIKRDEWRFIALHALALNIIVSAVVTLPTWAAILLKPDILDPALASDPLFLLIPLTIITLTSGLLVLCIRLLIYLPANASGQALSLRESFRTSKGSTLRLGVSIIITALLFITASAGLNAARQIEDAKDSYGYSYQDEMRENMREAQIEAGVPVTVPEKLPNEDEYLNPPPKLVDFLYYVPANVILNLLSILVAAGVLAQYYRWVMDHRTSAT